MSSVFSNLKPRNTVQKNGFDLSRRSVFSTKCGQILPVFCQATLPDSEYSIDVKQLLRTQPLQTAAFTGFSVNYDFFFVPNNYSYSSFNEFISQRLDSRHVGQPSNKYVPTFSYKGFMTSLVAICIHDYLIIDHFGANFGYSKYTYHTQPRFKFGSINAPWCCVSLEVLRSLDMFGYGNFLPQVKLLANLVWEELNSSDPGLLNNYTNFLAAVHNYVVTVNPQALPLGNFSSFVYHFKTIAEEALSLRGMLNLFEFVNIQPTLWCALAYNKAFYEFYRNVYYDETFNIVYNDYHFVDNKSYDFEYVELFNFDDWSADYNDYNHYTEYIDGGNVFARILAIFVPKYHQYKKDLFTAVLPSTQFGDVSTMVDDRSWLNLFIKNDTSSSNYDIGIQGGITRPAGTETKVSLMSNGSGTQGVKFRFDPALAISILEQRRADAMQRFKERMLRAGNKVKDVFKAHGWSEPYSANEANPFFIGTFDGRLDINTVAATTQSEEVELAQLGATGMAVVNGHKLRFKSHDFGYIVGVMYIVKEAEYDAYGVEKQHCLTDEFDYPYPELQNISLAPIDTLELSQYLRLDISVQNFPPSIIGYLPRFMEYKTAVDKVHGEFFSAPVYPHDEGSRDYNRGYGTFSDWVTPRYDINNVSSLSFLYQSPVCADNVFKVQANPFQETDQFLINCYFDVMAVEPVSVIGLPV